MQKKGESVSVPLFFVLLIIKCVPGCISVDKCSNIVAQKMRTQNVSS